MIVVPTWMDTDNKFQSEDDDDINIFLTIFDQFHLYYMEQSS